MKNMCKVMIPFVFLLLVMPLSSYATDISGDPVELDLSAGTIDIVQYVNYAAFIQNEVAAYSTGGCIIVQSDTSTATSNAICISADTTMPSEVRIAIAGLNINSQGSPISLGPSSNVVLSLAGNNMLNTKSEDSSAIGASTGSTLTISGSGSLNANGGSDDGCGISAANLIINNGTIIAKGGSSGAGISGKTIEINGGVITASGGKDYYWGDAGIRCSAGNKVTINGGTVVAYGGGDCAGIGGVKGAGSCGDIQITGGSVTAYGSGVAAGIGAGAAYYDRPNGGVVTITGGAVTASGYVGIGGAGISHGCGNDCADGGIISIDNASVTASGNIFAIGGGSINNKYACTSITIGNNVTLDLSHSNSSGANYQEKIIINSQPLDSAAHNGNSARFTVDAEGHSGLSYQWQVSKNGEWDNIVNQTNSVANIPVSDATAESIYRCAITNGWGNTVYSNEVNSYILQFSQQPADVTTEINDTAALSVASTCSNVTYQWQKSYDNAETWQGIVGKTAPTLVVLTTLSENDALYRCIITATNGDQLASDTARITVSSNATTYTTRLYLERAGGNGYDLAEQIVTEATAGVSVTAAGKTFDHFTENTAKGTHSGTVQADNSLILSRYYDRDSYTIIYETNGGTAIGNTNVKYGASLSLPTPSKMGYTFGGWYSDAALSQAFTDTTMPGENVKLYAKWTVVGEGRGIEYKINGITLRDSSYQSITAIPRGTFYAEVSVTNLSSTTMDTLLLATYDANGRMLGLSFLYANPQIGQTFVLGASFDNNKGEIAKIKAFMLPMLGGFTPLAEAVEYGS